MKDYLNMNVGDIVTQDELLKIAKEAPEYSCYGEGMNQYCTFNTKCGGRVLLYHEPRIFMIDNCIIASGFQFTYHSTPYGGDTSVYIVNNVTGKIKYKIESSCNND